MQKIILATLMVSLSLAVLSGCGRTGKPKPANCQAEIFPEPSTEEE